MTTPPKPYVRPQPLSKDKLREMLAQAVRNTQPELNPVTAPAPEPKVKRSARPKSYRLAKRPTKGRKDRA
jgi:hypothetical protein